MRTEFSKSTKRIIAARAGNECSYPNCPTRIAGPDITANGMLQAGVAAYIYSAFPDGPTGQGGHTLQELMHDENGIWLCIKHATLVDANNGAAHPAEKLLTALTFALQFCKNLKN
jgi:hypothetical protein